MKMIRLDEVLMCLSKEAESKLELPRNDSFRTIKVKSGLFYL